MNRHDRSYRRLLGQPRLVRELFEGLLRPAWSDLLDWSRLRALPTDFISDTLRQRQGDRVWSIPRRDGNNLYILLMLEHQSTDDAMMALRLNTYCSLLLEQILQRDPHLRGPGRLPMVLPVVLYSGTIRWKSPTQLTELFNAAPKGLQRYLPSFRYLLIDEAAWVERGDMPTTNLATLLFRLEHNRGIEDVQALMQTVYNCTLGEEHQELRRAFAVWLRYVLLERALPEAELPDTENLLEIQDMLADNTRSWTYQWRREAEASLLIRQLSRKFGALPSVIEERLRQATPAQLEAWSLNLLDAKSLDEVWGEDSGE